PSRREHRSHVGNRRHLKPPAGKMSSRRVACAEKNVQARAPLAPAVASIRAPVVQLKPTARRLETLFWFPRTGFPGGFFHAATFRLSDFLRRGNSTKASRGLRLDGAGRRRCRAVLRKRRLRVDIYWLSDWPSSREAYLLMQAGK